MNCELTALHYWSPRLLWDDPLHVMYIGVGRDFAASAISLMARRGTLGWANSQDERLELAFDAHKAWLHTHQLKSTARTFVPKKKTTSINTFPELQTKGFDTKLVLLWLGSVDNAGDPLLHACCYSVARFVKFAMFLVLVVATDKKTTCGEPGWSASWMKLVCS